MFGKRSCLNEANNAIIDGGPDYAVVSANRGNNKYSRCSIRIYH
jgi:hypothetical protein